jgi:hypothetical protein
MFISFRVVILVGFRYAHSICACLLDKSHFLHSLYMFDPTPIYGGQVHSLYIINRFFKSQSLHNGHHGGISPAL